LPFWRSRWHRWPVCHGLDEAMSWLMIMML
jgi:hypothetical protein